MARRAHEVGVEILDARRVADVLARGVEAEPGRSHAIPQLGLTGEAVRDPSGLRHAPGVLRCRPLETAIGAVGL